LLDEHCLRSVAKKTLLMECQAFRKERCSSSNVFLVFTVT
jgi:hypothetical protein